MYNWIEIIRVSSLEFHDVDLKACLCWACFSDGASVREIIILKCCVMLDNFVCLKERVFDISY